MTETIEQKALALVNAVRIERGFPPSDSIEFDASHWDTAFYRAIEAHEAFRQEVSDAAERLLKIVARQRPWLESDADQFASFIIRKPDPLAEAWIEATGNTVGMEPLNAALAARGLKIVEDK